MKKMNKWYLMGWFNLHMGLLIMAAGLYIFLIPSDLAVGGVTGLAMVIQNFIPSLPVGVTMIILNIFLFTLAFVVIGKSFGGKTIYCSFLLAGMIGGFEWIFPLQGPIVEDIFLNLIFGISIQGIGMAIIFHQNASTGGTDIVAKIIHSYTDIPIGKALFLSDALITLAAGFAFGPELGLYAFLGITLNGLVIDKMIESFNEKVHLLIVTDQYEIINEYIKNDLQRGSTFLNAVGGYTYQEKRMISAVMTKKEFLKLKHFTYEKDEKAFITVTATADVLGEGFSMI